MTTHTIPPTYTIYSKPTCKFCKMASNELIKRGNQTREVNIEAYAGLKEIIKAAGFTTVPIIYGPSGDLIGSYEDLMFTFMETDNSNPSD